MKLFNRFKNIQRFHILFGLLYLTIVVRLWLMPFGYSLWLDETATYWNVMHGFQEALHRSSQCPGNFQLYMGIVALSTKLFGLNEIGLRIPSAIALGASSIVIYKTTKRFSNSETGIYAVVIFACMPELATLASNARPYALTLLCAISAMYLLIRFHDTGKYSYGLAYSTCAALMVYMHVISSYFILLFIIYSVISIACSRLNNCRLLIIYLILLLLILPFWYSIISSGSHSHTLSVINTPDISELIRLLFTDNLLLMLSLVITCKIALGYKGNIFNPIYNKRFDVFLFIWFLLPPVLFYFISIYTDYRLLVPRYLILSSPALALFSAALIYKINSSFFRHTALTLLCVTNIIIVGKFDLYPTFKRENWREALSTAQSLTNKAKMPLLFNSGLIETKQSGWSIYSEDAYLFSPLSAYPVNTDIIPLPLSCDTTSWHYLETVLLNKVLTHSRFLVVFKRYIGNSDVDSWLSKILALNGYNRFLIGNYNGVVLVFYSIYPDDTLILNRS